MPRVHFNPKTGNTGDCSSDPGNPNARGCPFGKDAPHYNSHEEAREAYSKKMESEKFKSLKKTSVSSEGFINEEKYRNIKKMPALFVIDREKHVTLREINPNAAWIFEEESRPTLKKDGTSITVTEDGRILARRSVKKGKKAPEGFIHAETDPITGHSFGVEPIESSSFYKMFKEAAGDQKLEPGTYELVGEKINNNPEKIKGHTLLPHGAEEAVEIPDMRTVSKEEAFDKLKEIFAGYKERGIEGVVWWGANGKRAKLRVKDFFGDPYRR